MNTLIDLKNVTLDFPVYDDQSRFFRNKLLNLRKTIGFGKPDVNVDGKKIIRGLDNITLNFTHGDRVAIMGLNGSGKTTLLKLIAGVYTPTSGTYNRHGSVSCMLDLGFGFEEDATGYENILLSQIMRGSNLDDIDRVAKEAAEFSGLGDFLNMPLRTYSQGMKSRIAFSSAIVVSPQILLIDEFFSTGDFKFSEKSKNRILETMEESSILLFASHDIDELMNLCNKGIFLENGELKFFGDIKKACDIYQNT